MTPNQVLELAREQKVRQFDLRFTDLPGLQQHVSYPISQLTEDAFEEGFGIDGSSIRGWAAINESDMLLIPDPATAFMDPFDETPTLVMTCDVIDPITRQHYERDPRWIAKKAETVSEEFAASPTPRISAPKPSSSFSTTCASIRISTPASTSSTPKKGRWNSGREKNNLGYRPRYKEGYFPVPPTDHYQDLRAEMVETMIAAA